MRGGMAQAPRPASINDQESCPWPSAKRNGESGHNNTPLGETEALALRRRQSDVDPVASEDAPRTRLSSAEINKNKAKGKGNDIPDRDVEIQYPHNVLWRSKEHLASELKERSLAEGLISKGVSEEAAYKAVRALFSKIDAKDTPLEAVLVEGMAAMFNTLSLKEDDSSLPPIPTEKYVANWTDPAHGGGIVNFMRTVWKDWFPQNCNEECPALLTRAFLRRHDPAAAQAISNFERKTPWPNDLPIPTTGQIKARLAAELQADPEAEGRLRQARRDAQRIARAMGRTG